MDNKWGKRAIGGAMGGGGLPYDAAQMGPMGMANNMAAAQEPRPPSEIQYALMNLEQVLGAQAQLIAGLEKVLEMVLRPESNAIDQQAIDQQYQATSEPSTSLGQQLTGCASLLLNNNARLDVLRGRVAL